VTVDAWIVLAILTMAIVLFITEWIRLDVVALGVVGLLMLSGILTTEEALSGFSNGAVLTITALFIVGGGVMQTGVADQIGRRILAVAGTNDVRLIVVLMAAVGLLSGFMSSTGTVAILLPAVLILARRAEISPAKLLMPLAFGSLLGGALTLIGTPPNIIVSDALKSAGYEPFGFFDFTPIGLLLLAVGVVFMVVLGRHMLPDRRAKVERQPVLSPKELVEMYQLEEEMMRLRVRRSSPLVGRKLGESGLRSVYGLNVLRIMRPVEERPAFSLLGNGKKKNGRAADDRANIDKPHDIPIVPTPETIIGLDDALIVQGESEAIAHAAAELNLGVQPPKPKDQKALVSGEVGIAEIILPPRSTLIGKTLADTRFGSAYKLTVLNISRPGAASQLDLKQTRLEFGDALLVQGPWKNIIALRERPQDFIVTGEPEAMVGAPNRRRAPLALLILAAMVAVLILDLLPIVTASILASLVMVLVGCLTMDEGYQFINWKSVVLVAGMLPMGIALDRVGLVDLAAQGLVDALGGLGPRAVLLGLALLTTIFTQIISNTATTVIIAPVALAAARGLDISPYAFLMGVAIAASLAFASPVASPSNTLVMGAGNYRFGDYAKIGVPMIVIMLLLMVLILPFLWPF